MSKQKERLVKELWSILGDNVYSLTESQIRDLKFYILEQSNQVSVL